MQGQTRVSAEDGSEAHRHTLLRPRHWWDAAFAAAGASVNAELVWGLQERDASAAGDRRERSAGCRWEGAAADGGEYEVCVVDRPWLVGAPEQGNLRRERCVTPANGELEPWLFAYRKTRG